VKEVGSTMLLREYALENWFLLVAEFLPVLEFRLT
jgi:hypothetical protein